MNTNNAYTVSLNTNSSASDENGAVNSVSPTWLLTFVRFENRDSFRNKSVSSLKTVSTDPLIVENDCVTVTTTMNKGTLTPSMEATLKETDVNYMDAVAPGDFVFINMLNWENDIRRVAENAKKGFPINGPNDGFKGLYKVQSIRKSVAVNEAGGEKSVFYKIDGYGFTEFNNTIYFNPNLLAGGSDQNFTNFISQISKSWANLVNKRVFFNLGDVVSILIKSFIGTGFNQSATSGISEFLPTGNTLFYVPSMVGKLMGLPKAKAAKDIYSYIFGLQNYSPNSNQTLAQGLNPKVKGKIDGATFYYTPTDLQGETLFAPEYWNCNKAWAIINQYINSPLNEIYTCYKLNADNKIYPTVVFRQIPFTTQDFETRFGIKTPVTKFLSIPRWKLDSSMVFNIDIGRDEAARVNFYQYFSRGGPTDKTGAGPAQEIAAKNFIFDSEDVKRSGLRPSITFNLFDPFTDSNPKSPVWSKIMADSVFGSHLKLNGTVECIGIVQPICIGDNLEFEGVVFHIETVIHHCYIDTASGVKRFKTVFKLSSGVSLDSTTTLTKYADMENTNAYQDRKNDYENLDKILPGVSESQNVLGRPTALDVTNLKNQTNDPFPQPTKPKRK